MRQPQPAFIILHHALILAVALPCAAHATKGYFAHGYGISSEAVPVWASRCLRMLWRRPLIPRTAYERGRLYVGLNYFAPKRSAEIKGNGFGLDGQYSANGKSISSSPR